MYHSIQLYTIKTQIIHDNSLEEKNQSNRIAFQQNQEAIVAENQFNQFTKEFTERTHRLTAKEQSDDFETQRFILDECNIILGTEIPELLNKNWQLLSNRQSKLEILRQHKVLLSDWKKFVDREETFKPKCKTSNRFNPAAFWKPQSQIHLSTPNSTPAQ